MSGDFQEVFMGGQDAQLPFGQSILEIAKLDLKKVPDSLPTAAWMELQAVNTRVNGIFTSASHEIASHPGQFPIVRFVTDKRYPQYIGELVRLSDDVNDVYIHRHPTLYDNQKTGKSDLVSETTIYFAKHINNRISLVASYPYLTDETHQLLEGNPLQSTLLHQRGIRADNQTSFFGLKAKCVKWELWLEKQNGDLTNIPFPVENHHGTVAVPDRPSLHAVDLRTFPQILEENSGVIGEALELVDIEGLKQDFYNATASKWSFLLEDARQKYRLTQVSIDFLKESSKILTMHSLAQISREKSPLLPGDISKQLAGALKKLSAEQVFGNKQ